MKRCLSSLKIRGGQIQMECYFSLISVVVAVQSLNHVWLFLTLWPAACQARLSSNVSQSLLKFMSIKSVVMISNHLILCYPLLLLPSIFLSIKVFSKESVLCIRWLKYWSFSFSITPSNEYSGLISCRTRHGTTDWFQIGKGEHQGYILSSCLFNLYAEYFMRNAGLEEAQAGIKNVGRKINNLRYADDATLMAESEEI